ncbi:YeeE/YedE family protein [Uliginosibacterium sp. H3]|uniref:YeeE/YedE family protein n=1 Tax=Uliginosibacterium silvisoli TaxID=3114758 RepID=A0ABU6K733_9RHOO|nr:YeeE/YedE family protein [Uliginosibacterium sp. H3]
MSALPDSSLPVATLPPLKRLLPAVLVLALAIALSAWLGGLENQRDLALSSLLGIAFGVLLQRARFCFFCVTRDFLDQRDARGLLGIIAALVVGTLGYHLVFGAFLPVPAPGRLPPEAHVGPLSWVLAAGAFSFGAGMSLSGSCISAHLYRLGEGSLASPVALLGAGIGFILGFASWNTLYLATIQEAPVVWLPNLLGYGGSVALQLALLGGLALWLAHAHRPQAQAAPLVWWQRRWPAYVGGILIGTLAALSYLRVGPLGVTAELGSIARTAANTQGWLPERLEGLDTFSGCATVIKETLWSKNGAFVVSLVLGAFASALLAGEFKPVKPGLGALARNLFGGVLMGWGAMLALGCTVGTLLSGIMAGAVSGWVFALSALAGLWLGWRLRQRWGR